MFMFDTVCISVVSFRRADPCGPNAKTSRKVAGVASKPSECRKLDVRLNMTPRPIVNKYCVGKLKRTLKREFNST